MSQAIDVVKAITGNTGGGTTLTSSTFNTATTNQVLLVGTSSSSAVTQVKLGTAGTLFTNVGAVGSLILWQLFVAAQLTGETIVLTSAGGSSIAALLVSASGVDTTTPVVSPVHKTAYSGTSGGDTQSTTAVNQLSLGIGAWSGPTGTVGTTGAYTLNGTIASNSGVFVVALTVANAVTPGSGTSITAPFTTTASLTGEVFGVLLNPALVAPGAPTGLTATPGNNSVALSWTAPAGTVTSYTVLRGTTNGGPYPTTIGTPAGTSLTDNTAVNGTTYYYVVNATNGAGTGPNSAQASATPEPPAPAAPTGLTATPGNASVALSWTAPAGTVTSYTVLRGTTNGGPYPTTIGTPAGTSLTDNTVVNNTTYYYVVNATNAGGTGPNSAQASATPTDATQVERVSLLTIESPTGTAQVERVSLITIESPTGVAQIERVSLITVYTPGEPDDGRIVLRRAHCGRR